jgi:hypothetical protein
MGEVILDHLLESLEHVIENTQCFLFWDFASLGKESPEITTITEALDNVLMTSGFLLVHETTGMRASQGT